MFFVAADIFVALVGSCCRPVNIIVALEFISSRYFFPPLGSRQQKHGNRHLPQPQRVTLRRQAHMCVHCRPANSGIHIRLQHTRVSIRRRQHQAAGIHNAFNSNSGYVTICATVYPSGRATQCNNGRTLCQICHTISQ